MLDNFIAILVLSDTWITGVHNLVSNSIWKLIMLSSCYFTFIWRHTTSSHVCLEVLWVDCISFKILYFKEEHEWESQLESLTLHRHQLVNSSNYWVQLSCHLTGPGTEVRRPKRWGWAHLVPKWTCLVSSRVVLERY